MTTESKTTAPETHLGSGATALENSGSIEVGAIAEERVVNLSVDESFVLRQREMQPGQGPISADELKRRGITDDLDARAIDVVMRCGWPRQGDPLGTRPCVLVPESHLKAMHSDVLNNGRFALDRTMKQLGELIREHDRIKGLYLETAEQKDAEQLSEPAPKRSLSLRNARFGCVGSVCRLGEITGTGCSGNRPLSPRAARAGAHHRCA